VTILSAKKLLGPVVVTAVAAVAVLSAVLTSAGAAPLRGISMGRCAQAPGHGLTLANVAAAGSRLVAVGSNGLIATATSSAPARWTQQSSPVRHDLRGVVWTGSRWVVVGDLGTILSGTDARVWQAARGIPSVGLRAIAARPGLLVAAGSGGSLVSSTDGLAWTPQHSGTSEILWGGARMGSTLLVSGKNATVLASMDGSSWRNVPTYPHPTDDQAAPRPFLWQLAAQGPRLVAVGDFGGVLDGSLSGLWAVQSPTDEILRGVAFGRGVAVAVGSSGVILRAVGRGRWASVPSPTTADLRGVAYTGSRFVAVGDQSTIISSRDGLRWQIDTTAMPCALLAVTRGAGRYVAVGGAGQLLSSSDGRVWTASRRPTGQDLYALAYGRFGFIAAGADGTVLQSADGQRWAGRRLATRLNMHAVTWTGREYLIGGDRGQLFASGNGVGWRRLPILAFHSIRDFATAGTTTVAAGAGTVARRGPGGQWTLESVGFGRFQTSIAAGAGRFVIVGHNGEALVSTDDGRTWTAGATGAEINLDRVVFAGGRFIATGEGTALSSRDGLSWSTVTLPTPRSIRSIAVNGPTLVAVGDGETILRSTDRGCRWRPITALALGG
jgi:hypothetical protein